MTFLEKELRIILNPIINEGYKVVFIEQNAFVILPTCKVKVMFDRSHAIDTLDVLSLSALNTVNGRIDCTWIYFKDILGEGLRRIVNYGSGFQWERMPLAESEYSQFTNRVRAYLMVFQ